MKNKKPNGYWTEERLIEEAKKYKYKKYFIYECRSQYYLIIKKGLANKAFSHMIYNRSRKHRGYWTEERILEEAKKYEYKRDFYSNCGGAAVAAVKFGVLKKALEHTVKLKKPSNYWTKEKIIEEARKYKSRKEFQKNNSYAYLLVYKYGIGKEAYEHMDKKANLGTEYCKT